MIFLFCNTLPQTKITHLSIGRCGILSKQIDLVTSILSRTNVTHLILDGEKKMKIQDEHGQMLACGAVYKGNMIS